MMEFAWSAIAFSGALISGLALRWLRNHGYDLSDADEALVYMSVYLLIGLLYHAGLKLARVGPRSGTAGSHEGAGDKRALDDVHFPSLRGFLLIWAFFSFPFAVMSIVQISMGRRLPGVWSLAPWVFWFAFVLVGRMWLKRRRNRSSTQD